MRFRDLDVLDASERVEDQVMALIQRRSGRRLLYKRQLREAVHSVSSNIGEAFGRGAGRDRARVLRIARGEAEEAIRHLASNLRASRITSKEYWQIHNRLVVIVKMLNALASR